MKETEHLKISYILTSAGLQSNSVQDKVVSQIHAMNENGLMCRGLFFSTEITTEVVYDQYITLFPVQQTNLKYFNRIQQNKVLINTILRHIKMRIQNDELIYLRYPGASYELYKFVKKYKGRIISEHQAKEIDEIKSSKDEHPFGFKLSKLFSYFLYRIWPIYNEKLWGVLYSRQLKAKVAVTNEIAEYHKKNCENVLVIPNGIETKNYSLREIPELNSELKILFLKGTSSLAPWNGLDRLIKSIDAYEQSSLKIQLIICGNILDGEIPERSYIVHMGYQNTEELDKLFSTVHIGCSTLCLFRKNLYEAAVLKAREYFTRGLPFIYAYSDPDIQKDDEINQYALQFNNDDSIIDFNKVISFAKEVSNDLTHNKKMRIFAEEKLDWNAKMGQLKVFLMNLK
ncbi:MAG: hypothetical protein V4613_10525 [Bacteroidota bacterium]